MSQSIGSPRNILLVVAETDQITETQLWLPRLESEAIEKIHLQPRGIGPTRWTRSNPPNYVERSHALLGTTADAGRVLDVAMAARYLRARFGDDIEIRVAGAGRGGIIAAYAALFEPGIDQVTLVDPPASHLDEEAPAFLNVLRVCDIPQALGMIAPRSLHLVGADARLVAEVSRIYAAANANEHLSVAQ
jgi:hypothetical protein